MRARFPLYLKFSGWFLLNLALLTLAFYFLLGSQFGIGLDSMLKGRSGDKIKRAVELIGDELRDAGPDGWGNELGRFSEIYGITFSLYRSSGEWGQGPDFDLPDEVAEEIKKHSLPIPNRPRIANGRPPEERRDPAGLREARPLFLIKTNSPKNYWLGARIPLGKRGQARERPPRPGADERPSPRGERPPQHPPDLLLARTDRLSGNDLLPDLRPWFAAGFGAVALSVLFWIPFVRSITHSLWQMRDATREVAAGHFDARVEENRSDELGQLGYSINRMSAKLEGYVDGQRRFLGDIAHELCSPIARMQMALGVLEQKATAEQRPRVEGVREELEHIADMVNELLSFSKASLQPESVTTETVALGPLINDIARRETGGRDAEIGIEESSGLSVLADKNLLGRALGNLLRNAMRYAGDAGPIGIDAEQTEDDAVEIRVSDRGPGIPEDSLDTIFDPFCRPDGARTPGGGGAGLGLAIVKTCIEACGGSVRGRNTDPGFEVTLVLKATDQRGANQ